MSQGRLAVGTSGFDYDHWQGRFYPADLTRSRRLNYYSRHFDTLEVNRTFYGLPKRETVQDWAKQVESDYVFALKFSRYGSHLKHLLDPEQTVGNFLERVEVLGSRMGPILVQLPPHWKADHERLDQFLTQAGPRAKRWAVEIRDPSWLCEDVFDVLQEHKAALVIHDMLEGHPWRLTTDWTYLRYHGNHYQGSYTHQKLTADAGRLADLLEQGVDVYAYFNNDDQAHAVENARQLRDYVRSALDRDTPG
ncbi:MAG: DUF72 domain-containing protein [Vulcanimicrobiota bacterium]